MSASDTKRLSEMRSNLDYLDRMGGVADKEFWLRQRVGENGLRELYDADYLTSDEFERWIGVLYAMPGATR